MLIEIFFAFSAFQCGSSAPQATFSVEYEDTTILEGQTVLLEVPSVQHFYDNVIINNIADADCASLQVVETVGFNDTVPTVPGAYNQTSLYDWHATLNDQYESLRLFELGTSDENSSVYDLQDLVLVLDTMPVYAD